MSYILEALKKAQAERQLGSAPTIHAAPIHAAPAARGATSRMPLFIGVALLVAGGVAAGLYQWRGPAVQPMTAPPPPPPVVVAPAPTPAPAPVPPPVLVAPAPVSEPAPAAAPRPAPVARPAPVKSVKPAAPKPEPVPEDSVPALTQLPEAIQREVPAVAFGGYIYSKNPADRLLLIDKVLRHEGEEIKPGLTLERLLPKAAIMNYKGYRYRVPY